MAIFKKQTNKKVEEVTKVEEIKEPITEEIKPVEEPKEEIKEVKKTSIKKGSKVIANGRCFGDENLTCPLKTVRNYETKILEVIDKSVLIDEGWISKENIK